MGKKIKTKIKYEVKVQKIFIKNSFLRGVLLLFGRLKGIGSCFLFYSEMKYKFNVSKGGKL